MNETLVTMIGNVASTVSYVQTAGGVPMANFRLATTERRYDRARGDWVDGDTTWVTVVAWRWLAANVVSSLGKGDPVVVSGRLRVREWEDGGHRRSAVEIDARVVGHDLGRGTSAFRWAVRGRSELVGAVAGSASGAAGAPGAAASSAMAVPVAAGVGAGAAAGAGGVGMAAVGMGGWPAADRRVRRFGDEAPGREGATPLGEAVPEWIVEAVREHRATGAVRARATAEGGDRGGGGGAGAAAGEGERARGAPSVTAEAGGSVGPPPAAPPRPARGARPARTSVGRRPRGGSAPAGQVGEPAPRPAEQGEESEMTTI